MVIETEALKSAMESARGLHAAIFNENLIDNKLIAANQWSVVAVDDSSFGDDEIAALNRFVKENNQSYYFSIPCEVLGGKIKESDLFYHSVDDVGWQGFFKYKEGEMPEYMKDRIYFDIKNLFLILQTGETRHTIYSGSPEFLKAVTGVDVGDGESAMVGNFWPDGKVERYYNPTIRV